MAESKGNPTDWVTMKIDPEIFEELGVRDPEQIKLETKITAPLYQVRADIGGHHYNGIAEIHLSPFCVRKLPLFHDLKKDIMGFRMRLFHFIKNDDGVWAAAYSFCELPGFFISDISRRSADHPAYIMPFHELGHIQLYECILASE